MPHYRISRRLPNGWHLRLEMVSYDSYYTTTPSELDEVVLLEVGTLKAEFDTLPVGLMQPMTLSLKLIWDRLPAAMRDYLDVGYGTGAGFTGTRNIWYMYTDRGTNQASWTLEFVGVEDNIESLELEPLPNGMYSYNVELVDSVYYYMKVTPTFLWVFNTAGSPDASNKVRSCYQTLLTADMERTQEFEFWAPPLNALATFKKLSVWLGIWNTTPLGWNKWFHLQAPQTLTIDHTNELKDVLTHAVEMYRTTTTSVPRVATGAALTSDELWFVKTIDNQHTTIGGMFSDTDAFGISSQTDVIYDTLRSLCEQGGVRVGYRFQQDGNSIRVIFDVRLITQARDHNKTSASVDATLQMAQSLETSSIKKRGDNILKAESRWETTSDKDVTQLVKIQQGARASRSFNFEPVFLTLPVDVQDNSQDDKRPRLKAIMRQTNQLYWNTLSDIGAFVKPHEKTRFVYGAGASDYVELAPTSLNEPVNVRDWKNSSAVQTKHYLQINDAQINGCNVATVVAGLLQVFSNEQNAIFEMTLPISSTTKTLHDYICGRYALAGAATAKFPSINWNRAVVTSIEVDFVANTVKHSYMLVR